MKNDKPKSDAKRRPYEPPQVTQSASFESLAMTCARSQPDPFVFPPVCNGGPMSSS